MTQQTNSLTETKEYVAPVESKARLKIQANPNPNSKIEKPRRLSERERERRDIRLLQKKITSRGAFVSWLLLLLCGALSNIQRRIQENPTPASSSSSNKEAPLLLGTKLKLATSTTHSLKTNKTHRTKNTLQQSHEMKTIMRLLTLLTYAKKLRLRHSQAALVCD